ncbi:hypothetical protein FOA52_013126 [Chlamydomonas sp. UWO 241]|nr:hypothetical protein FOA52_013126 [Chlamydomonas sp. UWO 241]
MTASGGSHISLRPHAGGRSGAKAPGSRASDLVVLELKERIQAFGRRWEVQATARGSGDHVCQAAASKALTQLTALLQAHKHTVASKADIRRCAASSVDWHVLTALLGVGDDALVGAAIDAVAQLARLLPGVVPPECAPLLLVRLGPEPPQREVQQPAQQQQVSQQQAQQQTRHEQQQQQQPQRPAPSPAAVQLASAAAAALLSLVREREWRIGTLLGHWRARHATARVLAVATSLLPPVNYGYWVARTHAAPIAAAPVPAVSSQAAPGAPLGATMPGLGQASQAEAARPEACSEGTARLLLPLLQLLARLLQLAPLGGAGAAVVVTDGPEGVGSHCNGDPDGGQLLGMVGSARDTAAWLDVCLRCAQQHAMVARPTAAAAARALSQEQSTAQATASPFTLGLSLLLQMCGRAEAWHGLTAHPEGGPGLPTVLALLCAVIERPVTDADDAHAWGAAATVVAHNNLWAPQAQQPPCHRQQQQQAQLKPHAQQLCSPRSAPALCDAQAWVARSLATWLDQLPAPPSLPVAANVHASQPPPHTECAQPALYLAAAILNAGPGPAPYGAQTQAQTTQDRQQSVSGGARCSTSGRGGATAACVFMDPCSGADAGVLREQLLAVRPRSAPALMALLAGWHPWLQQQPGGGAGAAPAVVPQPPGGGSGGGVSGADGCAGAGAALTAWLLSRELASAASTSVLSTSASAPLGQGSPGGGALGALAAAAGARMHAAQAHPAGGRAESLGVLARESAAARLPTTASHASTHHGWHAAAAAMTSLLFALAPAAVAGGTLGGSVGVSGDAAAANSRGALLAAAAQLVGAGGSHTQHIPWPAAPATACNGSSSSTSTSGPGQQEAPPIGGNPGDDGLAVAAVVLQLGCLPQLEALRLGAVRLTLEALTDDGSRDADADAAQAHGGRHSSHPAGSSHAASGAGVAGAARAASMLRMQRLSWASQWGALARATAALLSALQPHFDAAADAAAAAGEEGGEDNGVPGNGRHCECPPRAVPPPLGAPAALLPPVHACLIALLQLADSRPGVVAAALAADAEGADGGGGGLKRALQLVVAACSAAAGAAGLRRTAEESQRRQWQHVPTSAGTSGPPHVLLRERLAARTLGELGSLCALCLLVVFSVLGAPVAPVQLPQPRGEAHTGGRRSNAGADDDDAAAMRCGVGGAGASWADDDFADVELLVGGGSCSSSGGVGEGGGGVTALRAHSALLGVASGPLSAQLARRRAWHQQHSGPHDTAALLQLSVSGGVQATPLRVLLDYMSSGAAELAPSDARGSLSRLAKALGLGVPVALLRGCTPRPGQRLPPLGPRLHALLPAVLLQLLPAGHSTSTTRHQSQDASAAGDGQPGPEEPALSGPAAPAAAQSPPAPMEPGASPGPPGASTLAGHGAPAWHAPLEESLTATATWHMAPPGGALPERARLSQRAAASTAAAGQQPFDILLAAPGLLATATGWHGAGGSDGLGAACTCSHDAPTLLVPAHRMVLAAQSEYFHAALHWGLDGGSGGRGFSGAPEEETPLAEPLRSGGPDGPEAVTPQQTPVELIAGPALPVVSVPEADAAVSLLLLAFLYTGHLSLRMLARLCLPQSQAHASRGGGGCSRTQEGWITTCRACFATRACLRAGLCADAMLLPGFRQVCRDAVLGALASGRLPPTCLLVLLRDAAMLGDDGAAATAAAALAAAAPALGAAGWDALHAAPEWRALPASTHESLHAAWRRSHAATLPQPPQPLQASPLPQVVQAAPLTAAAAARASERRMRSGGWPDARCEAALRQALTVLYTV